MLEGSNLCKVSKHVEQLYFLQVALEYGSCGQYFGKISNINSNTQQLLAKLQYREWLQWNFSIKDLRNKDTSLIRILHVVPAT